MTRRTRTTTAAPETDAPTPGATDRIVASITQAIIERRLMPGTKLVEQKLADIFGCSRTLVRQALNQLSRDRLVTLEPARGAFVAQPSVEEARQVFEVRELLESALVRHLVTTITKEQVEVLRTHLSEERAAVRAVDVPGRTRLLADFHVLLARVAGNEVMGELMSDLLSRSSLISLMYQSAHSAEQSHAEHVALVDALAKRDARAAAKLMAQHIHSVKNALCFDPQSIDLAAVLQPVP